MAVEWVGLTTNQKKMLYRQPVYEISSCWRCVCYARSPQHPSRSTRRCRGRGSTNSLGVQDLRSMPRASDGEARFGRALRVGDDAGGLEAVSSEPGSYRPKSPPLALQLPGLRETLCRVPFGDAALEPACSMISRVVDNSRRCVNPCRQGLPGGYFGTSPGHSKRISEVRLSNTFCLRRFDVSPFIKQRDHRLSHRLHRPRHADRGLAAARGRILILSLPVRRRQR